jgi:hypothetical protein
MEDKKNFFDLDYDSKTIRILPSYITTGKTMPYYTMSMKYWTSEEDRKRDLRKSKIKNILNAIDL